MQNTTFRQLDINKYQVIFFNTDQNTPDLIVWELKTRTEHQKQISFAETRKTDNEVEMEIHLKQSLSDVPNLIRIAAEQSAQRWKEFADDFEGALKLF